MLLNNGGDKGATVATIRMCPDESLDVFVSVCGQEGKLPLGGDGGCSVSEFEG